MNRLVPALVGMCALLALGACGSSHPYQQKRIKVETSDVIHTVHFPKGSSRLGLSERRNIAAFVSGLRAESVQAVEIETHGDAGLSHTRAHLIKQELIAAGFPTPVFRHDYINKTVPDVNVHVTLAVAIAPLNCPDWASRAAPNFGNEIHSNYACATRTNIARQTANAMDLAHGRTLGAPDADRTQALMVPYKANTVVTTDADSASGQ